MPTNLEEQFDKFEKPITEMVHEQKDGYFQSGAFTRLNKRVNRLRDSNDMKFGDGFKSKMGFPIQKVRSMGRKFIFDQNYRGENLINVQPTGETDKEIARNIEDAIVENLNRTRFRHKAFNQIKLQCSEYGTGVSYSVPGELYNTHLKTVRDEMGQITRKRINREDVVIHNYSIDCRNKFQDPNAAWWQDSPYHGHLERMDIAQWRAMISANQDVYIKRNVMKIWDKIKESGGNKDQHFSTDASQSYPKWPVDRTILYSPLNIKGNEDGTDIYYIEMVDDKIIRIQKDLWDENLMPYSVFNYIPRGDVWWGGTDGELVLPHENFFNTLMGLKLDMALRALDQYIFYAKGSIDTGDWNNRHVNGGLIGIDLKDNMQLGGMLQNYQFSDQSLAGTDRAIQEINSSIQSTASSPNVNQRQSKNSPLQNTTATAVNALQEVGDIKEGSYMEQFNYGMITMARNNIVLMQQTFPDDFAISTGAGTKLVSKDEIFGSVEFKIKTALTNNKAFEAQRLMNGINTLFNLIGTQHPSVQGLDPTPIIKGWLEKSDFGDVREIMKQAQPQQGLPPQVQPQQPGGVGAQDLQAVA